MRLQYAHSFEMLRLRAVLSDKGIRGGGDLISRASEKQTASLITGPTLG